MSEGWALRKVWMPAVQSNLISIFDAESGSTQTEKEFLLVDQSNLTITASLKIYFLVISLS